jgi:polyphosphate kinase 2
MTTLVNADFTPKTDEADGSEAQAKCYDRLIEKNELTDEKVKKVLTKYLQEQELKPFQAELINLQKHLEQTNQRMIILFEGRDAAGKGGTIRRVTRYMNEKHYRIIAMGKPTDEQRTQWFFQKYVSQFPHGGEIAMFDRSWYNRAMVEPVFGFCSDAEYKNFMKGVGGFEKDLVRQGTILVKIYFSVTKDVQQKRFDRRKDDPLRQWKLSEVDVQAQERWEDFDKVKFEMLRRTHTASAPWTVIRSTDKHLARLNAIRVILNSVDYDKVNMELDYVPDDNVVISGAREIELMQRDRLRNKSRKKVADDLPEADQSV